MSACEDYAPLLHGLLDGELDAANALRAETHMRECPQCAAAFEEFIQLRGAIARAGLSYAPSPKFGARVRAALEREIARRRWRFSLGRQAWGWPAAAAALAASAFLFVAVPRGGADLGDQIVAGHIRSLMANHLMDVETSDHHTVKPWFAGRLAFSPPVYDLAAQGFPLAGGRVDFVNDHPVAAVIYRHGAHVINLFIWPTRAGEERAEPLASVHEGYNVRRWTKNGMSCWAVSDLNGAELAQFENLIKTASPL